MQYSLQNLNIAGAWSVITWSSYIAVVLDDTNLIRWQQMLHFQEILIDLDVFLIALVMAAAALNELHTADY